MKTKLVVLGLILLSPLAHASRAEVAQLGANLEKAMAGDDQALISSRRLLGRIPGLEYVGRLNNQEFRRAASAIKVADSADRCWVKVKFKDSTGRTIVWQAESTNVEADLCFFKNHYGGNGSVHATITPMGSAGSSR